MRIRPMPPRLRMLVLLVLAATSAWNASASAQTANAQPAAPSRGPAAVNPESVARPVMRATRTARPIVVDGRLDESSWALATVLSDFVQQLPETGFPATFRTDVRVLYDQDNLYVGAINYDPAPDKAITVGLERDFVSTNSDIFGLVLDTFHDRRNAFLFIVNPKPKCFITCRVRSMYGLLFKLFTVMVADLVAALP